MCTAYDESTDTEFPTDGTRGILQIAGTPSSSRVQCLLDAINAMLADNKLGWQTSIVPRFGKDTSAPASNYTSCGHTFSQMDAYVECQDGGRWSVYGVIYEGGGRAAFWVYTDAGSSSSGIDASGCCDIVSVTGLVLIQTLFLPTFAAEEFAGSFTFTVTDGPC